MKAREGHAEALAIAEITQSTRQSIEKHAHRRRLILRERLREMPFLAVVPQKTWEWEKKERDRDYL